jgi:hypothetical protein
MAESERRAVEAAFADRVCEIFRTLCLGYTAHNPENALRMFEADFRAAQAARDAALKVVG